MEIPSQDFKICTSCGKKKSLIEFYKQHNYKARTKFTAVMAECKKCTRKRTKKRYYGPKYSEIREKDNKSIRDKRARIKDAVFIAYGGYKCACCGETEKLFLTIDHIDNNGASHRRKITGKRTSAGYFTYNWIIKNNFPEGFQVLCMNCNHGKHMNNGICPHKVRSNDYQKRVELSSSKRIASYVDEDIVCSISKDIAVH